MPADTRTKILIAEDDKFLLTAMSDKLEHQGFAVIKAANGREAAAEIKKEKPDLILLDLMMPQMTGFEVLAEIKLDPTLKHIPVLVLSNLGQDPDIRKAKDLGAVGYLVKSDVQMKEVVEKIKEHLAATKR